MSFPTEPRGRRGALIAALFTANVPSHADTVACHVSYGGETRVIEATPAASPYTVAPVAIGSYFLFRIVYRTEPADLAGIKLYTYAEHDRGPALIHQASYNIPSGAAAGDSFTGRQRVYEPLRDGELEYWCTLKAASRP